MSSEGGQDTDMSNEISEPSGSRPTQAMAVMEYNPSTAPGASMPVPSPHVARNPHTLQDVLRYSIGATDGAAQVVPLSQMDDERRRFLEASLRAFTSNAVDQMSMCIKLLLTEGMEEDERTCEEAFEQIIDLVGDVDNAKDFHKIGGFQVITPGLNSTFESIRALTATLIAELSQNNPYIQDLILETNFFPLVVNMVNSDPDSNVQVKSLYAVSCIVREHEAALKAFAGQQGWSVLLKALQSSVEKLQLKVCFLLSSVCTQTPPVIEELCELGYVEQLCGLLSGMSRGPLVEHLLRALLAMASNSKEALQTCLHPQLQLRATLANLLDSDQKDLDDYRYAQEVKASVFGSDCEDDGER